MSDPPRAPNGRSSTSPPAGDQSRLAWLADDDDADMDYVPAESGEEAESLMDDELDDGDFHGTPPRPLVATTPGLCG